jgi:GT2 family glycosyltransferase
MSLPSVAVIVPVHGRLACTRRFLDSFEKVNYAARQIIVIDDGSPDDTARVLACEYPPVRVLSGDGNLWWAGATNLGVRHALRQGFDFVLTLNNDAVLTPNFLSCLVETATANPRSIVGSRINYLDPPDRVWGVGGYTSWCDGKRFPLQLYDYGVDERTVLERRRNPFEVELLTGCGSLIPTECYRTVGLYDRRMLPQYHADADFTLRARKHGYRILVDLRAVIYNDEPQTSGNRNFLFIGSPWYWKATLALHLRHCPKRHLAGSLARQSVAMVGRYVLAAVRSAA